MCVSPWGAGMSWGPRPQWSQYCQHNTTTDIRWSGLGHSRPVSPRWLRLGWWKFNLVFSCLLGSELRSITTHGGLHHHYRVQRSLLWPSKTNFLWVYGWVIWHCAKLVCKWWSWLLSSNKIIFVSWVIMSTHGSLMLGHTGSRRQLPVSSLLNLITKAASDCLTNHQSHSL